MNHPNKTDVAMVAITTAAVLFGVVVGWALWQRDFLYSFYENDGQ